MASVLRQVPGNRPQPDLHAPLGPVRINQQHETSQKMGHNDSENPLRNTLNRPKILSNREEMDGACDYGQCLSSLDEIYSLLEHPVSIPKF